MLSERELAAFRSKYWATPDVALLIREYERLKEEVEAMRSRGRGKKS